MKSGIYQISFRGLTLAEIWRFSDRSPLKLAVAFCLKIAGAKGEKFWLPASEAETVCEESALSAGARERLLPVVQAARNLGYVRGEFRMLARNPSALVKEMYSHLALHQDGIRTLYLVCASMAATPGFKPPAVAITGTVTEGEDAHITFSSDPTYLSSAGANRQIHVPGGTLEQIDAEMLRSISQPGAACKAHASFEALKAHRNAAIDQADDARIARGFLRYVSNS